MAVVDPNAISNETIAQYHEAGVRGLRVNFGNGGTDEEIIEAIRKNARVARLHDWVVQIFVPLKAMKALHSIVPGLGVRVVFDHFMHAQAGSMTGNLLNTVDPYSLEGFSEAIDLVRRRLLFAKISAPYRNSKEAPLHPDMRVIAQTIMLNGPEMVVYGSDWPFTSSKQPGAPESQRLVPQDYREIDIAAITLITQEWCESSAQVQRMFVDNPRRLWQ